MNEPRKGATCELCVPAAGINSNWPTRICRGLQTACSSIAARYCWPTRCGGTVRSVQHRERQSRIIIARNPHATKLPSGQAARDRSAVRLVPLGRQMLARSSSEELLIASSRDCHRLKGGLCPPRWDGGLSPFHYA